MSDMRKYIYGIINSDAKKSFSPYGYTISYRDISAVVSDSEIVDYTHMPKDAVARLLVGHQKVIEGIMSFGYIIIPMRLGTFAVDETEVRDILNKGYKVIKDILTRITDKIEIDVIAAWSDFTSLLKEVGEEKEIKEFKERLLSHPKGITVDDQVKVGAMIKEHLDRKAEKYALEIREALKTLSQDFNVHTRMDDRMVMNAAFLINKDREKDFDRKVQELNREFAERLNFRCVGPLPPYSFYMLEIKKMKSEEINWAREKLGLDDFITKDELKKAFHRSALSFHPDKNPDKPGVEAEFDDVTKAYRILVDYCLASEQAGQGDYCSLNFRGLKKDAILVKVRE
jgi:hypothetical protein